MLIIRLARRGSKKHPQYRVVVSDSLYGKGGGIVENVGTYNPRSKPALVQINKERVTHWLSKGARPSDSVRTLLTKHLSRDLSAPVAAAPAVQ